MNFKDTVLWKSNIMYKENVFCYLLKSLERGFFEMA